MVVNSRSKSSHFSQRLYDVLKTLSKCNYETTTFFTKKKKDTYNIIVEHGSKYDLIVVSGGDGSIFETTNALAQLDNKPKVMYFPTGTVNDFGNSLGLGSSLKKQLSILKKGEVKYIDTGYVNGTYFNYVCAFGPFTSVSYKTSSKEKAKFGKLAYYRSAIVELPNVNKQYYLEIEMDDKKISGEFAGCLIVNSNSVAGFRNVLRDDCMDDGLFNLVLIKKASPISFAKGIGHIIEGIAQEVDNDYFYVRKFKKIKISSNRKIQWTLDGEKGPIGSIELEVLEKNLGILA